LLNLPNIVDYTYKILYKKIGEKGHVGKYQRVFAAFLARRGGRGLFSVCPSASVGYWIHTDYITYELDCTNRTVYRFNANIRPWDIINILLIPANERHSILKGILDSSKQGIFLYFSRREIVG
jgi:hypothetical protein